MNTSPLLRATLLRTVVTGVVVALVGATTPAPVQARIVTTEEALARVAPAADAPTRFDRAAIDALFARGDVRAQLESLGVDPAEAQARVQALDDAQAQALAEQIDQLPAGGSVLGAVLLVFVILLVTDILGFTRVFPFTRPIR